MAAIRALEARSLEFMHEKEEKKRLEQRIAMLMGQMIRGERNPGDHSNGVIIHSCDVVCLIDTYTLIDGDANEDMITCALVVAVKCQLFLFLLNTY